VSIIVNKQEINFFAKYQHRTIAFFSTMFRTAVTLGRSAATIARGFRMWMPTMPMVLVNATNATTAATAPDGRRRAATAIFRVLPKMTKHEIKEYLNKIYELPVTQVRTMNYMGKRKRATGKRRVIYYKYRDFKKAVVTFGDSITDLGLGVRIPELEDDDDDDDDEEQDGNNYGTGTKQIAAK
jgi:large subunit ribosomal protein L23